MNNQRKRNYIGWDISRLTPEKLEKIDKYLQEEEHLKRRERIAGDVVARHGLSMEEALSEGAIDLDDLT